MSRAVVVLCALGVLLCPSGSSAEEGAGPVSIAVLPFEGDGPLERSAAVYTMVATRIAHRPRARVIGVERIREALGAESGDPAIRRAAEGLGASHLLRGRVDRFGDRLVLAATLVEAATGEEVARFRVDALGEEELPAGSDRLGDQIAEKLGLPPAYADAELITGHELIGGARSLLGVKLGSTLAGLRGFSVDTFTLRVDLEGEAVLKRWLHAYVELGMIVGRAKDDATQAEGTFSLIPAGAGLKFIRPDGALRPYFGLGVGLGFFASLFDKTRGVAFRVDGTTGVVWMPWERVGALAELRAGVDTERTWGFTSNFGILFAF